MESHTHDASASALTKQMQSLELSPDSQTSTSALTEQMQSLQMSSDNNSNILKPTLTPAPTPRRIIKEQHHYDRTYQCLIVWSEYDCGHELSQVVRDPRCWKCEETQPRLCRLTDWDIGADGLCLTCDIMKKGEERARQRRLAMGLTV